MVAWKRFPVPEFEYAQFKDMAYAPPERLAPDRTKSNPAGGYAIDVAAALAEMLSFKGDHLHGVLCVLPSTGAHMTGRSHAWRIQRLVLLNGLDADAKFVADWKTTRPINTRLGPDDGIDLPGGAYLLLTGHRVSNYWISNRTVVQNGLDFGNGKTGFRVLAASDDQIDDFHDSCVVFEWALERA